MYVVGTQKNLLVETVLFSTKNTCLNAILRSKILLNWPYEAMAYPSLIYNCMCHTRGPSDQTIGGFNGDN